MKFVDHGIIVRIVLEAAAGINRAGDAEAVQFSEEEPRGIELILPREFRAFGERRVEDVGVGFGQEKPCRIAMSVPLNFAGGNSGVFFV